MAEKARLNHLWLMENTKNDKERAKKDQGDHCQPVKYD